MFDEILNFIGDQNLGGVSDVDSNPDDIKLRDQLVNVGVDESPLISPSPTLCMWALMLKWFCQEF